MQPTFLPWIGYFSLINSVEKFVFLDNVQFESRSWQQRNRILNNNQVQWLTVPVTLPSGQSTTINDVLMSKEHYSSAKIRNTLIHAYSKSDWTKAIVESLYPILENSTNQLSAMNKALIVSISKQLGIDTEFIHASNLNAQGEKGDLLLSICKILGADTYISPLGSRIYLDEFSGFRNSGIEVEYQNFVHPTYSQVSNSFVSHLSVIDALCNIGTEDTAYLVKGN
jgi:hypothetical protein